MHKLPFQILLVDDSRADVRLIREALRNWTVPFSLEVAEDGERALDIVFADDRSPGYPDLIVLDINLPNQNGHEVLSAIKGNSRTRTLPVIMMSSSEADIDIDRAYDGGASCYIQKPSSFTEWCRVILGIEAFWFKVVQLPFRIGNQRYRRGMATGSA